MFKSLSLGVAACMALVAGAEAIDYPGATPGKATVAENNDAFKLSNNLLDATWTQVNGKLQGPKVTNLQTGEVLQAQGELFGLALTKQVVDDAWVYVGVRLKDGQAVGLVSMDGTNWSKLGEVTWPADAKPALLRIGKMDKTGGAQDFPNAGESGVSEFLEVNVTDVNGKVSVVTGKPARIHRSANTGTKLEINNERGTIEAAANVTAFSEYKVDGDDRFFSARIKRGSDKGMSWAPGLALVANSGQFVAVGVRDKDTYNLLSQAGEQVVKQAATAGLNCDLMASDFLASSIKAEKLTNGVKLTSTLKNAKTGIQVVWSAELLDGSNYFRQEFTLTGKKKLDVWGLQLMDFGVANARQLGQVPGSPVVTDSFFTGVEMPVTTNFVEDDGFRSGFGCYLPFDETAKYAFGTVVGVYPKGQIRRAFNFYLERERATPSYQFLHYNNWYDFYPTEKDFLKVIEDYGRELTEKRGVKLDSFVMDDGWDNYNEGLWTFNRTNFPDGFTNVAAAAQKIGSNLGVWISPLGGYGGSNERTEHARKMGLIEDKLDLSQPGYYKWYLDKCLEMIRDYKVNYFKWDKAGSGVDPHFMALLRIGQALKQEKSDLFLNVTVGTWPSPFWLNHIDSTWRDGSGDVAWHGPGDKRESWLTYRDMYCYRLCVAKAPLYPINSLMHHGLVIGHHYQGKPVATAGADFKNAARSYFAMGPNLQELYLSTDLMTPSAWDEIAESAKWSKANQKTLVDAHWIGGDPGNLEVYGAAAWRGNDATLMLRNPNDKPQSITLTLGDAFELPKGAPTKWQLKNSYADQKHAEPTLNADQSYTFELKPFEVVVFNGEAR